MTTGPMYEAFRDRVAESPWEVCVEDENGLLSRDGLNDMITALAGRLITAGAAGRLAGIFVDRGRTAPACILAVQAAGGAYLPLDPKHPDSRVADVLTEAAPACVLSTRRLRGRLPDWVPVIIVDDEPGSDPRSVAGAEIDPEVAYVIFTSGSTGKPKGVAIGNQSLEHYLSGMDGIVGGADRQIWPWVSSIGFDSTVTELLWPLTRGHHVCIGPSDPLSILNSPLVKGTRLGQRVTSMQCTPSLARILVADPGGLAALRSLKVLLLGGEPFPVELIEQLVVNGRGPRLGNAYGPTEATVAASVGPVDSSTPLPISIGAPLPAAGLHILDEELETVSAGTAGRLFISGDCLALGYWNHPELTAERFVPVPVGVNDVRMYDTGDIAIQFPHGIVVTGRADDQVKIRGNRVELPEVEQAILKHPSVRAVGCVADSATGFGAELIAFVVLGEDVAEPDLPDWLSLRLPEYMVPAKIVTCGALPLNSSGKIDRRALLQRVS